MAAREEFGGFPPGALEFFVGLAKNNEPGWFKPRKAVYDSAVRTPLRALILALSEKLKASGIPLVGDPDRGMFRIYRDVRFSADKRLYKTHAGAVLTRSGGRRDPGLLYLHLGPGQSEAAVGFWRPEPGLLGRLRRSILSDPAGFLDMIGRLGEGGHQVTTDTRLARLPRGFETAKGAPVADHLRWRRFICEIALSDAEMQSQQLVNRITDFAAATQPLFEWGWAAADYDLPPPLTLRMPTRPLPKPDF